MSDIEIQHAETMTEYTYSVTGAPPLQLSYRVSQILPATVVVQFRAGVFKSVKVFGGRLKKDGTAGADLHEETFYVGGYSEARIPEWLKPLTEWGFAERREAAKA